MFIGVDVGTSAVKIVLVDQHEGVVAVSEGPLRPTQPRPLWSEDDPDAWWVAVLQGLDRLAAEKARDVARVRATGLSGQMHGAVLLDAADRPVRPAILWNDGRSSEEVEELAALDADLQAELGVLAMPGFTGPKLLWLRRHEAEAIGRTRHILLPKDTVRLRLTDEHVTDVSDAAGTWLFDQGKRRWSARAIAACGVDPDWLPRVVESTEPAGRLRADLARRWGMTEGVPVVGGAGDVAAGGIGIGAIEAGQGFISLGTSAQIFVAADRHDPDPPHMVHAFCHAAPGRWFRMAALLNGASPLAAVARWTGRTDLGRLLAAVEAAYTGPSSLLALPYLYGERTPHNDPTARGAIVGLTASTETTDIVQAILESVAFSLADGLAVLNLPALPSTELGFIGGGARPDFWGGIIASVLGLTLVLYEGADQAPAFGTARLARAGVTGEALTAVAVPPPVRRRIVPDARCHGLYAPRVAASAPSMRPCAPAFRQRCERRTRGHHSLMLDREPIDG